MEEHSFQSVSFLSLKSTQHTPVNLWFPRILSFWKTNVLFPTGLGNVTPWRDSLAGPECTGLSGHTGLSPGPEKSPGNGRTGGRL